MKRGITLFIFTSILIMLGSLSSAPVHAEPDVQGPYGHPIDGGFFFTATAPPGYGFAVVNDDEAAFWDGFNELGGLQNVGYPISRRFNHRGFLTQAFQKLVLQWRPEVGEVWPVNIFDDLSYAGFDERLFTARQTPYHIGQVEPPGTAWAEIKAGRLAYLDANPAIRERYFSLADPLTAFGLPTSKVEDMGNHYALRTQRAVFQQWKEEVDWASAGQVVIANGGDIAKELGAFPAEAIEPEPAVPGDPTETALICIVTSTPQQVEGVRNRLRGIFDQIEASHPDWEAVMGPGEPILTSGCEVNLPDRPLHRFELIGPGLVEEAGPYHAVFVVLNQSDAGLLLPGLDYMYADYEFIMVEPDVTASVTSALVLRESALQQPASILDSVTITLQMDPDYPHP